MQLYRFSPIKSESDLLTAVKYVVETGQNLSQKILGRSLPMSSMTIFSHYEEEFETLTKIIKTWGDIQNPHNGPRVKLKEPIHYAGQVIDEIRIRKPDPYRTQVGCGDFQVEDYNKFKTEMLPNKNLRCIEREDYEMIEFFHPDFDVFAYICSNTPPYKEK